MYYSPEGLLQLIFLGVLFIGIFGPGIWLVSKHKERKGVNTSEPKESDKIVFWGIGLTILVALIISSMSDLFSSQG